jgi:hypothetical protein
MLPAGFEPANPATNRPQTLRPPGSATGATIGKRKCTEVTRAWCCCCCCSCRLGETMSLNCGHQLAYCLSPRYYVGIHGGMILRGKNRRTRTKTCPSATLSTTYPTWTDPGTKPCLRRERPATNRLSSDTASLVLN